MSTSDMIALTDGIRDADLRQNALLALLEAGDDLDHDEARKILRRTRFRAAWAVRQQRNRSVSLEVVTETEPEQVQVRTGAMAAAFKLLALLPEHHRQAYLLRYVSGYSVNETAELLGVHRWTVWSWLRAARETFDKHIAGEPNIADHQRTY